MRVSAFTLLAASLLLAACSGDDGPYGNTNPPRDTTGQNPPPQPGTANVSIYDSYFNPSSVTVSRGSTVRWANGGSLSHTVTANNNAFNSGSLAAASDGYAGGTFSFTFTQSGTFGYRCTLHAGMTGTVTVTP